MGCIPSTNCIPGANGPLLQQPVTWAVHGLKFLPSSQRLVQINLDLPSLGSLGWRALYGWLHFIYARTLTAADTWQGRPRYHDIQHLQNMLTCTCAII